jgi:hypothetical protein
VAGVHACNDQDRIYLIINTKLLQANHTVPEVLARVQVLVVLKVIDTLNLLQRGHVLGLEGVRGHDLLLGFGQVVGGG